MAVEIFARRYDTGEPVRVVIVGTQVTAIEPAHPRHRVNDWPYLAPGLVDLQINGHGGVWFSDSGLTPDQVTSTILAYPRFGVTRLCPTLITNSQQALESSFAVIAQAIEASPLLDRLAPGLHLEGPYISPEDGFRGAHPREHVRPADWSEFTQLQRAARGRIRLVTLAPEVPGAIEFIRAAVANGIVISLGHTAATAEQIAAAVEAGAQLSTHLGNGCAGMLHRHRNPIWDQLGEERLIASIITDGHHLPGSMVRSIIQTKSPRRVIITCDASGWAGCPPGSYGSELGRSEVLPDGRLVVAGQRELLAGSALETDACVARAMLLANVSLRDAVDMASRNPARLLRWRPSRLRAGDVADLTLFHHAQGDDRLNVLTTFSAGERIFGNVPEVN